MNIRCQLLVFVRFVYIDLDKIIKQKLLLLKALEAMSKVINVMQIITNYFEFNYLKWEKLVGFVRRLVNEKKTLDFNDTLHHQALTMKMLLEEFAIAMGLALK